jgi:hypothetical protein
VFEDAPHPQGTKKGKARKLRRRNSGTTRDPVCRKWPAACGAALIAANASSTSFRKRVANPAEILQYSASNFRMSLAKSGW